MKDEFQVGSYRVCTDCTVKGAGLLYWAFGQLSRETFPHLISDNTHIIVSTDVKLFQLLQNKKTASRSCPEGPCPRLPRTQCILLYSFKLVDIMSSMNVENGNAKFILPRGVEISKATTITYFLKTEKTTIHSN